MNLLDIFETAYSAFTRINLAYVHTKLTSESSHRNQQEREVRRLQQS